MLQCGAKKVNPVEPFVTSLPVAAVLPELLTALKTAPQVLLSAPTGAGKSTWLPLQLLQQGPVAGKILLLEPRRLAARNVAQRLAEALNEKPGETVGYRMRAQSCGGAAYPAGSGDRRRIDQNDSARSRITRRGAGDTG